MKIALFAAALPEPERKVGGVDFAVHRLANELAKDKRDEVTVLSISSCPINALYEHKQLFVNVPWLKRSKIGRLFILPFLLNFINLKDFDVIHLHGDDWFYVHRPIPSVRTLHGSALNEARSATSLQRKLAQYAVYPLEHVSVRLATIPLAVGKDTAEIYKIRRLIDNGVNLQLFYAGDKATDPCILFVGNWDGRKRGRFVFEAFINYILPEVPNSKLYMVSDFCSAHPNVVDVKFPDDETLARLYREAWVFALPSLYEGFGIPYLEALASGTAIVSSKNSGAEYILDSGKYGVIADDDSFSESVVELLINSTKRTVLENIGKIRAKEFSWDIVALRHRKIYTEAVSNRKIKQ
jgi:glycosyltransferase involved in cell wall biosynthesis